MATFGRISNVMATLPRRQKTLAQARPSANGSNWRTRLWVGILQDADLLSVGTVHRQQAVAKRDEVIDQYHSLQA